MPHYYMQIWQDIPHVNWDAALTLGTCAVVIARVANTPIVWVYRQLTKNLGPMTINKPTRFLLHSLAMVFVSMFMMWGILMATLFLGYWEALVLQHYGIEQGVIRPYTSSGLIPTTQHP